MLSKYHRRQLQKVKATDAARLRFAMSRMLLTQEALERRSSVPQSTISKILNGQRRPSIENAVRLAHTFKCSIEDLFPSTVSEIQLEVPRCE